MAAQSTPTASLRITRSLAAPREKVFEAWTRPEALRQWFCHPGYSTVSLELDARVGGAYRVQMLKDGETEPFHVEGVYKEIRRPDKLVFTWRWSHVSGMTDTLVTVELREAGGSTELVLTHELFDSEQLRDEHDMGWNIVLGNLTTHLG